MSDNGKKLPLADYIKEQIIQRDSQRQMTCGELDALERMIKTAFINERKLEVVILPKDEIEINSEERGGTTFINIPRPIKNVVHNYLIGNNFFTRPNTYNKEMLNVRLYV